MSCTACVVLVHCLCMNVARASWEQQSQASSVAGIYMYHYAADKGVCLSALPPVCGQAKIIQKLASASQAVAYSWLEKGCCYKSGNTLAKTFSWWRCSLRCAFLYV